VSGSVRVNPEEAELARAETQAVLALIQDETRRGRLADLLAALAEGELGEEEAQALGELLELGLQSGRVRSLYGPGGELAALAVYRRLPAGRELAESAANLNAALRALAGKTIAQLTVRSVGPGEYGLSISADDVELDLRLGRAGARLATIGA
jgi:hypothetical protein